MAGKQAIEQSCAAWLNQDISLPQEPVSVMSSTPSPLTPKGQRRRHAILTAAADVFILHGYEGTTLDMIIEQSGGSRSTLYTSFGGKEALFLAVIDHRLIRVDIFSTIDKYSAFLHPISQIVVIFRFHRFHV